MLVRTRQLDRSGGGGLPIAPEKRPDPTITPLVILPENEAPNV